MTRRFLPAAIISVCLGTVACSSSKSDCLTGSTKCGTTCVNVQEDQLNCGACGNACSAGQVCSAGACAVSCQASLTSCSGSCVNAQTDRANCGTCGNACAAGKVCSAGACGATCAAPYGTCGTGSTAYCADVQNDRANCGACGHVCPTGKGCSAGACVAFWSGRRVFTTCGATGPIGPAQLNCDTAYLTTLLEGEVAVSGGSQRWTVPVTANYRIEASGAQGASGATAYAGGKGATVKGDFALTAGQTVLVLVGQQGQALGKATDDSNGGGGGGSFVVDYVTGKPLVVAGGGGGTRYAVSQSGCDGRISQEGGLGSGGAMTSACDPRAAGTAGTGGIVSSASWGSGGGGFTTDGATDGAYGQGGFSFAAGGNGGTPVAGCEPNGPGGFGGGGTGNGCSGGGGAGGYSGGDGGRVAGGGGSFNAGANPVDVAGASGGDGFVTVELIGEDPCVAAPGALSLSIAGPARLYNYCWYLGAAGATCDAVCAELQGSNLAIIASASFPDSCMSPSPGDVSTWFYDNGNACGWTGTGTTGYKTLGYGYQSGAYYGKCAAGGSSGNGAFPGDPNNNGTRCVACPCFSSF